MILFLMTDLREFSGEVFALVAGSPAPPAANPPPPPPPAANPPPPQLLAAAAPFLAEVETSGELVLLLKDSGKTFSREVASARIFDLGSGFLSAKAEWLAGNSV